MNTLSENEINNTTENKEITSVANEIIDLEKYPIIDWRKATQLTAYYDNSFNSNLILKDLNAAEQDIFFTFTTICSCNGGNAQMTYSELKKKAKLTGVTLDQVGDYIDGMYTKLNDIKQNVGSAKMRFSPFDVLSTDLEKKTVNIGMSPRYMNLFFGLSGHFTKFDLDEHNTLSSKNSKILYRLLKQYRTTGYVIMKIEDFRELFSCENIDNKYLARNIINPCIKDLTKRNYFKNLRHNIKKDSSKPGTPITHVEFFFEHEKDNRIDLDGRVIEGETFYVFRENEHITFDEYDELVKLYSEEIVNGFIKKIIDKNYMGWLNFDKVKELCEEKKAKSNHISKKKDSSNNSSRIDIEKLKAAKLN